MATYNSKAYLGRVPFRCTAEQPTEITATVVIPSGTDLAQSDTFNFLKIGAGYVPLEITVVSEDLDEHADTPTLTLDVGIVGHSAVNSGSAVADYFVDGSTIVQDGGVVRVENGGDDPFADGALVAPSDENYTIFGTCATASGGAVTSDKRITLTAKIVKASFTAPLPQPDLYEAPAGLDNAPSVYA